MSASPNPAPAPSRRRLIRYAVLAATLAVLAVALFSVHPVGQDWLTLVYKKATGQVEEVRWSWVLRPPSFGGPLKSGFVTLAGKAPSPCQARYDTALGVIYGRAKDEALLEALYEEQLYLRIYDHDKAGIRAGDVVLDVGGHLGTFAWFALARGAKKVVMFEPEPVNAHCLRATFAHEIDAGRVVLVEAAAMDKKGTVNFGLAADKNTGMGKVSEDGDLLVKAVTIDDTVEELKLASVDFIKMDIEGAERFALAGALKVVGQHKPRMALCTYHAPLDAKVLREMSAKANPDYKFEPAKNQTFFY